MCEFCMQRGTNSDDSEFAGFFSTAAIEEAMALANKLRGGAGGVTGEDGTSDDTNTHNSSNDAAATDNDADDSDGT